MEKRKSIKSNNKIYVFPFPFNLDFAFLFSQFPRIGSDDPPLGVENVKIQENSEKIRGPPGVS